MLSIFKNKIIKTLLLIGAVFFIVLIIVIISYFGFKKYYDNKFYPGIWIAQTNIGGKTYNETKEILQNKKNVVDQEGIKFIFNNNEATITSTNSSFEIDLAQQIISFNLEKSLNNAFKNGKGDNVFINIKEIIESIIFSKNYSIYFNLNVNLIEENLKEKFNEFEISAQDASLSTSSISLLDNNKISFSIEEEKYGKIINYQKGIEILKNQLAQLDTSPINLNSITDYPNIFKKDCLNIGTMAQKIILKAPLLLKYSDKEWSLSKEEIANLLSLKTNKEKSISIIIGDNKIKQFFESNIISEINKAPIDAKFEITNGRVVEFQASNEGVELQIASSTEKINVEFINDNNNEIDLIIKKTNSSIGTSEVNDMGVKELIGTGYSNFVGSPANRIHNISTGSNSIKGLLVAPQEEFSLINALGEIDANTGYLPELVIKGNETIPEYGGGLCQVATTLFRAALSAGLEITARRNHSYRVSYYEPAGTDAAVYDPWPNVKFINDTKNHILIQTRMEGNELYYDFWGTNDGRVATTTYPIIYNITRPASTKIIETLNLSPGTKKCTEHAHNGADAYFDYTVNYLDKETHEERFSSHYVPWQEVCLLGVEKLSEDPSTISGQEEEKEENREEISEEEKTSQEKNQTEEEEENI
jgi:vancomycin resistance protein YoaR